jgi:glycosyltransferase involved in cell wall biosynthesis
VRILHIGYGFRPWRSGGLIEYAEDLMEEQVGRGHEVGYFFSGRQYPAWRRPWLHRWNRGGTTMWEVINSPSPSCGDRGTTDSEATLEAPEVQRMLDRVLRRTRPDVVHVQELAGLPSSLLDTLASAEIPFLMTLQDYLLLCPTLKLLDHQGEICSRSEVGKICPKCCRRAPRDASPLIHATIAFETDRLKEMLPESVRKALKSVRGRASGSESRMQRPPAQVSPELPSGDYQRRREMNLERLLKVDLLVAQSHRVEEIYRRHGVPRENIRTIHLTVQHLDRIQPRQFHEIPEVVHFGTLNGCISLPKGARLIVDALRILEKMGLGGRFHLHVWGGLLDEIRPELLANPNVSFYDWYKVHQLDQMLNKIHVGIIPSTWEEAFGYVGLEMLAKGVPIIGNDRGGIRDYTIDGVTGWINRSNDAVGLANLMSVIIANPASAVELNRSILAHRGDFTKTMSAHCDEMEMVYHSIAHESKRPVSINEA